MTATILSATERGIVEQFPLLKSAPLVEALAENDALFVVVGCGTSFYLAQSIAAALTASGRQALAVTGGEWWHRPGAYVVAGSRVHVIALSRSGESTETVKAAEASRARGLFVTALTCAEGSSLTRHADRVLYAPTHASEGVVMTASASLMLQMGLRLAGVAVDDRAIDAAEDLMRQMDVVAAEALSGRSHVVFLGAGVLQGIAQEGALKLKEMSLSFTEAYPTLDYRHGPIALADEKTLVIILYHPDGAGEEPLLARQIQRQGGCVIGIGGPGDYTLTPGGAAAVRPLVCLPALQILGERCALAKGLDTDAPRFLTKVVSL